LDVLRLGAALAFVRWELEWKVRELHLGI